MCGIYGIVSIAGNLTPQTLTRRRDLMAHRGPDDAGVWLSPDWVAGLAHRRLSVIDLSAGGHQPMESPDRRFTITFNGEIYNYLDLRTELQRDGHRFYGNSDTEVVLAAYAQWGSAMLQRLNGMFAMAIYDRGDGRSPSRLFLARDRAGKKPLYYSLTGQNFQFSSELKGLAGTEGIDAVALNHYLALGYIPDDLCFLSGVKKLPPAHAAELDITSLTLKTFRYWQLPENCQAETEDVESLADTAENLLMDSVRLRLISDVPVGVLLSGGLDSSLIVAAAAHQRSRPVKTFTIAVPGTTYDESVHARTVARHFATEHHVLEMHDLSIDLINDLAGIVDEPLADSSLIPTYIVSRLTREHVTVALGGDGGDELFGGYGDYPVALTDHRRWGGMPEMLLRAIASAAAFLPAGVKGRNRLASMRAGALQQIIWGTPYFDVALRKEILDGDVIRELGPRLEGPEHFLLRLFEKGNQPVDAMTRTHFGSILPDDFLVKVDRASMAHSLEMRSPFLDYRLVEFCFSAIPDNWKVAGTRTRRIEKRLARRLLPASLDIDRKQGFSIPMDQWLRQDGCKILLERMDMLPEMINRKAVERLIAGHMRGRTNGARIYALLMLSIAAENRSKWH